MKTLAKISFVAATMVGGAAFAADGLLGDLPLYPQGVQTQSNAPAKTRAQVQAELYATPFDGTELGEMPGYPQDYLGAQQTQLPALTRGQVQAELAQASVDGTLVSGGIDYPGAF